MPPIAIVIIILGLGLTAIYIYLIYTSGRAREKYWQMVLRKCQENKEYREAWDVIRKSGKKSIEEYSKEETQSLAIVFRELADDEQLLKAFNKMLNEPEINLDDIDDGSIKM
jgi:hypothetical protein